MTGPDARPTACTLQRARTILEGGRTLLLSRLGASLRFVEHGGPGTLGPLPFPRRAAE